MQNLNTQNLNNQNLNNHAYVNLTFAFQFNI